MNNKLYYKWATEALNNLNKLLHSDYTMDRNVLGGSKPPNEPTLSFSDDGTIIATYDNKTAKFANVITPYTEYVKSDKQKHEAKAPVYIKYITYVQGSNAYSILDGSKTVSDVINKLALLDDGNGEIVSGIPIMGSDDHVYKQSVNSTDYILSTNQDLSAVDSSQGLYLNLVVSGVDIFNNSTTKRSSVLRTFAEGDSTDMLHSPMSTTDTGEEDDIPPMEWITESEDDSEMSDEEKEEIDEQIDDIKDESIEKIKDELGVNIKFNELGDEEEIDDETERDEEDAEEISADLDEDEDEDAKDSSYQEKLDEMRKDKKRPSDSDEAYTEVF